MPPTFSKINFGDGLSVVDEGGGEITVNAGGGGGGDGIQFDTYPQDGGYLYLHTGTRRVDPVGGDYGIELYDASTGSASSIFIHSDEGEVSIEAGDQVSIWANSNMLLHTSATLDLDAADGIASDLGNSAIWNIDGNWILNFAIGTESLLIRQAGVTKTRLYADGNIAAAALPTTAGAAGTLYVDGSGFVKRA